MRIRLQGPGHAAALLSSLNSCRLSRQYCDVVLQAGSRSFAAHRAVLACAGTYFRGLFLAGSQDAPALPAFALEFVSPANLEKVLTFIYTGQIVTDLIDVGVLYELAERLGVAELVKACHATFPDLQSSSCKVDSSPGGLGASTGPSARSSSSAASCSSLSSSAGPSATPTPSAIASVGVAAPAPARAGATVELKAEDLRSHMGYGRMESPLLGGQGPLLPGSPPGPPLLHLKMEETEERGEVVALVAGGESRDACSFPVATGAPPTASGDPLGSLQMEGMEGGVTDTTGDGALLFVEEGPQRGAPEGEGEQWGQLADDIIELSDDENYLEDEEDEEDEDEDDDDLVCVENGGGGNSSSQVSGSAVLCKACSVSLPADVAALRAHAESHLTDTGLCRVCGALFSDASASMAHALSHVGVQLFSCDMCHAQFCSQNKLLRHRRQAVTSYTLPQVALTGAPQCQGAELQCAVCTKALSRDFQAVREHLQSHVCRQSLSCGVCHLPQLSLCSLLWHTLSHLAVPVYTCPHCGRSFLERLLLDRHMALHADEAAAKERERAALRPERLQCFLCPQTLPSGSALQQHLATHASDPPGEHGWLGKRKAEHPPDFHQHHHPPPPSSSSREVAGLVKMSTLGFNLPNKLLHAHMPPPEAVANGSSEQDRARGKWYRCRYCGKRFAHSGEFTYHLRIHTGEKPYQCKVCLRFFRGRSTMICHLKTHAGALMYRCTACGLYFSTLKLVSSHMELHKDHLPPDFNIEQTFMYNDHSKEPLPAMDV